MRILLIGGQIPSRQHGVRAADMVFGCLIDELVTRSHDVIVQPICGGERRDWTQQEQDSMREFEESGVVFLPPFFPSDYSSKLGKNIDSIHRPLRYYHPATRLRGEMRQRMRDNPIDAVVIFWNPEGLAATYQLNDVPKIVYYGMPDHAAPTARFVDGALFSDRRFGSWRKLRITRKLRGMERSHLKLMKNCDVVTNLSADHAQYYTDRGHPHSVYVPNMWPAHTGQMVAEKKTVPSTECRKPRIIGNIGRPAATGNTYGLKFLGEELLHRLDRELGSDGYEMHICGAGRPVPAVEQALKHPAVKMRGWVEDLDREIAEAEVFLVANNAGIYQGSHTRFLHAWSLKACCVGHAYNSLANPEMVHLHNVLLANNADEMAALIVRAIREPELRKQIGEAGFETYRAHFTPQAVVGRLVEQVQWARTKRAA